MTADFLRPAAIALLMAVGAPAFAHDGHDHGGATKGIGSEARAGDIIVSEGFSRATLPGAPVAGGFLIVTNEGSVDDRLVGATSEAAGRMEVHEMVVADGVMRMREMADGLPIPAGETVTLEPGGYHVMFMDLTGPLVEGEEVTVTLEFEKAGMVSLPLAILAPDARRHGDAAHGSGH